MMFLRQLLIAISLWIHLGEYSYTLLIVTPQVHPSPQRHPSPREPNGGFISSLHLEQSPLLIFKKCRHTHPRVYVVVLARPRQTPPLPVWIGTEPDETWVKPERNMGCYISSIHKDLNGGISPDDYFRH